MYVEEKQRCNEISAFKLNQNQFPLSKAYRFQITVNDVQLVEKSQTLDDRVAEPLDEAQAESLIVVLFDQLVQVEAAREESERETERGKEAQTNKVSEMHQLA